MPTHRGSPYEFRIGPGQVLKTTSVFDTYWRFAHERQALFMRRLAGSRPPWTTDPVLAGHRFTNVYRSSDRVSQFLMRHVQYAGSQEHEEIFFRTLLFKMFNRIETWKTLANLEEIRWKTFKFERYAAVLDSLFAAGRRVYSAAYIMPTPGFAQARKHRNHLLLLEHMMRDKAPAKVARARSLAAVFQVLRSYPSLGDFLAFQFTIDLNYTTMTDFSEMDFIVAGPGAKNGIRKCFVEADGITDAEIIRAMATRSTEEFNRLGLKFQDLWGRPLQLIDCQNLFCEVDKYARVAHPEFSELTGRTRIKQRFTPQVVPIPQWYPPKWKLSVPQHLGTTRPVASLPNPRSEHATQARGPSELFLHR